MARRILSLAPIALCIMMMTLPAHGYVAYDTHLRFLEFVTRDILRLLPRAMGSYIYQNRYDFTRGMTVMTRDIVVNPLKIRDLEEIRKDAYARLMRDIPYCVEAFKGGEIKLDTSHANLAGRLGMIGYSIILLKIPEFPDLIYLEKFSRSLDELISEGVIDVWVFYDGYGDYNSLGELMESLRANDMPSFKHVRNKNFNATMREDMYAFFRAPDQFEKQIVLSNRQINDVYSNIINSMVDAYMYIWQTSGMELSHPSYAAPPGTIIDRPSRRRILMGGSVQKPARAVERVEPERAEEVAAQQALPLEEAGAASETQ
ncbi:MAG: hypothetical protein FJY85_09525 [Deltaproteobacteria bacterium]|nr:hypothetical protein [Deltaproteobacteria bacterium]